MFAALDISALIGAVVERVPWGKSPVLLDLFGYRAGILADHGSDLTHASALGQASFNSYAVLLCHMLLPVYG